MPKLDLPKSRKNIDFCAHFGRARDQSYSMVASKRAQEKGNNRSFWSHLASKAIQWLLQNVLRRTVTIAHFRSGSRAKLFNGCFKTCSGEGSQSLILVRLASKAIQWLLQNVLRRRVTIAHFGRARESGSRAAVFLEGENCVIHHFLKNFFRQIL